MKHLKATRAVGLLSAALCIFGGCEQESSSAVAPGPKPAITEQARHASPAAAPIVAEDAFCSEHGVLEAVCTKCNPALIPVFKAKGDWCEEHQFPESFCPICHPQRGGRPAVDVKGDGAPADGTRVTFKTKDTARLSGIRVVKAIGRASRSKVTVTARIVYDASKVAEVNARSPGVVRAIRADIGALVQAGSPLAIIESARVGADQARLETARSRVQLAERNHARVAELHQAGITAEKNVLVARQDLDAAKADLSAARSALGMVGSTDGGSRYTLDAPIAGVITQRNATIGRLVDTERVLFEIVDTSSMWAELDIAEGDVARVAIGQPVAVTVDGLSGREFAGTLSYVSPEIDAHTRTAKGRVALENPEGLLRGNMFARAQIEVSGSSSAVAVPPQAIQRAKDAQLVFVRVAEDAFEARRVQVGVADAELVEVSGRLAPGDEVATDGSFLLKTETLKGSIGAGCCEVEAPR
jgi:cobalt-zinc-cadmium efflux system membrane fusion protein